MKLNLGCSSNLRKGFWNVDIVPPCDEIVDLTCKWPWETSTIEYVLAIDILEHLLSPIHTLNELWRVLQPGGIAEIEVPTTNGECAFGDPTHVSYWNRVSFHYFELEHPYHKQFAVAYGITARFEVVEEYTRTMADGPKLLIKLRAIK
jgi:predicted SAM-dependent methyltransferase